MAKKALQRPIRMSKGARRDFFELMQELVLRSGDLPIAGLARLIGYSNQSVHLALVGPRIPSWRLTEAITAAISGDATTERNVRTAWLQAIAEHREQTLTHQIATPKHATVRRARDSASAASRFDTEFPDAGLTDREKEVLLAWMVRDGKEPAAHALGIGVASLNGHLHKIRAKYASVGRPAPTKAALIARALQDGLADLHDL
jgi:DNA-binding CsgD family transcriptional regulator